MSVSFSHEAVDKILSSIHFPPRPSVLTLLMEERRKPDPDLMSIAHIIGKDVVLSAAVLKTVNSPFFGLRRKLDSIEQAVMAMGSNNVINIVAGLALRNLNQGKEPQLERFWDSAERTASIAAMLAKRIPGIPQDMAYTAGLFHDCGIPLLMQRFPDYKETLKHTSCELGKSFTQVEDERHQTNHAVVGYMLAKSWHLSEIIALTILHHHNLAILSSSENLPAEVGGLVATIQVAEYLGDSTQMREESMWQLNQETLLEYLGLSKDELADIAEEIHTLQTVR